MNTPQRTSGELGRDGRGSGGAGLQAARASPAAHPLALTAADLRALPALTPGDAAGGAGLALLHAGPVVARSAVGWAPHWAALVQEAAGAPSAALHEPGRGGAGGRLV